MQSNNIERARQIYDKTRLYHGTKPNNKPKIREEGLRREAHSYDRHDPYADCKDINFLTSELEIAKSYGKSVIRIIGAESIDNVDKTDPECIKFRNDIPRSHVLGSKSSRPGEDARIFREVLKEGEVYVTKQEAGELLREIQTDSEEEYNTRGKDTYTRRYEKDSYTGRYDDDQLSVGSWRSEKDSSGDRVHCGYKNGSYVDGSMHWPDESENTQCGACSKASYEGHEESAGSIHDSDEDSGSETYSVEGDNPWERDVFRRHRDGNISFVETR
jgi:type III effector protein AvrRpm1